MTKYLLVLFAAVSSAVPLAADDRHSLRLGGSCTWETLFREGTANTVPLGETRGTVLAADGLFPKVKARSQGLFWKGKNFPGDGTIVNHWLGFHAVHATISIGPSWLDGQPCIVMQYADTAPIFPGVRDELRQISPCQWLGRNYDGRTGKAKGWFLLEQPD